VDAAKYLSASDVLLDLVVAAVRRLLIGRALAARSELISAVSNEQARRNADAAGHAQP
jgi:hypothetical protein